MVNIPNAYPANVASALQDLQNAMSKTTKSHTLVVYGSLAKRTYVPNESDVNLALVLDDASPAFLHELRKPLRAAFLSVRLQPYVLMRDEIPQLVDAFPVKMRDIQNHHDLLCGEDPFVNLEISSQLFRLRTEQILRNHLIRLRRHAVFSGHEALPLAKALYASVTSLGIELDALLHASGKTTTKVALKDICKDAGLAFNLDGRTMDELCAFKSGATLKTPEQTFDKLLDILTKVVSIVDGLEKR